MKWVSTNFIIMDGQRTANFQLGPWPSINTGLDNGKIDT